MNTVANNLANVNTTGYKKDDVVFREFPNHLQLRLKDNVFLTSNGSIDMRPVVGELGTGVTVDAIVVNHSQGPLQNTGNRFDLALYGQGFFQINTNAGPRYTRDGSFVRNKDGFLTNHNGHKLIGIDNEPIQVGDSPFIVNELGEVFKYDGENPSQKLGQIKLVRFPEKHGLRKIGDNLHYATKDAGQPEQVNGDNVIIRQGFLEKSNVNAVSSMTRMIEVNRAYEANSKIIHAHDSALGQALQVGNR
jgi:flagellar basal-body rod protein FlgG